MSDKSLSAILEAEFRTKETRSSIALLVIGHQFLKLY